jgi:imidazolonepropionase
MILALATLGMGLGVAEAITASTLNAAAALGRADDIGSIEEGKFADLVILNAPSYHHLVYHYGVNPVRHVVKSGRVVVRDGVRTNEPPDGETP